MSDDDLQQAIQRTRQAIANLPDLSGPMRVNTEAVRVYYVYAQQLLDLALEQSCRRVDPTHKFKPNTSVCGGCHMRLPPNTHHDTGTRFSRYCTFQNDALVQEARAHF